MNGVDKAYRILGNEGFESLSDLKASETWFLKSFATSYPTMSAKPVREFFEKYKSVDTIHKTINKLVKEGRIEEATQLNQKFNKVRTTSTYKAVASHDAIHEES